MALDTSSLVPAGAQFSPDPAAAPITTPFDLDSSMFTGGAQAPQPGAFVGFDPASKTMFVNGATFHVDDHRSALQSQVALDNPIQKMPANFHPVSPDEYKGYITQIMQPSVGRLMSKNFGIGVDNGQMLAGRGLQFLGAEQMGQGVVDQQQKDLAFNEPYERQFTDIKTPGDAGTWFLANLAQQGPNLIESIIVGAIGAFTGGAAVGSVASLGRLAAVGGGGRAGLERGLVGIAEKVSRGEALTGVESTALSDARAILARQGAPNEINDVLGMSSTDSIAVPQGADNLLKGARTQAAQRGAVAATAANNYATGIGDIYGDQRDNGVSDRLLTAGLALPYAAMETAPEALAASRLLGHGTHSGSRLRRAGVGLAVGAVGEGATETGQEALLLAGTAGAGGPLDPNWQDRLINSFAAGAAVGGPIGAGANALHRTRAPINTSAPEADLLQGVGTQPEPETPPSGPAPLPQIGYTAPLMLPPPYQHPGVPGFTPEPQADPNGPIPMGYARQPGDTINAGGPEQQLALPAPQQAMAPNGASAQPSTQEQVSPGPADAAPTSPQDTQAPPEVPQGPPDTAMAQAFGAARLRRGPASTQAPPTGAPVVSHLATQLATGAAAMNKNTAFQQAEADRLRQQNQDYALAEQQRQAGPAPTGAALLKREPTQMSLPGMGAPYALRKGLQRGPVGSAEAAPVGAPAARNGKQGELFTKRGKPTAAANQRPGEAEAEAYAAQQRGFKKTVLKKGAANAVVQKPSPKGLVGEAPPGGGKAVSSGDAKLRKPATARGHEGEVKAQGVQALKRSPAGGNDARAADKAKAPPEKVAGPGKSESLKRQKQQPADLTPATEAAPKKNQPSAQEASRAAAEQDLAERVKQENSKQSTADKVDDAMKRIKSPDIRHFTAAAVDLIDMALFEPIPSGTKAANRDAITAARKFLTQDMASNPDLWGAEGSAKEQVVKDQFITAVRAEGSLKAIVKGQPTPWYSFAVQHGLLADVARVAEIEGLPKETKAELKKAAAAEPMTVADQNAHLIMDALDKIIRNATRNTALTRVAGVDPVLAATLTAESNINELARKANLDQEYLGTPLKQWFKDGKLNWAPVDGKATKVMVSPTSEGQVTIKQALDMLNSVPALGRTFRLDGTKIDRNLGHGKVGLLVGKMLSKFTVRPKVLVYRNVDDLKARNPALYKSAAAAREQGDFDTVPAAGYSFDKTIIIFSDMISDPQQLAFILAHEALGHYGMRAIMSKADFTKAMDEVYERDGGIRADAERRMASDGMDQQEATEEALADQAARVDGSILLRIAAALKTFMNKLGFKFQDDMTRYLISQSRRYLYNGRSNAFTADSLYSAMADQEEIHQAGRFATGTNMADMAALAQLTYNKVRNGEGLIDRAKATFSADKAGDIGRGIGRFLENVQTLNNIANRSYGLSIINNLFRVQSQLVKSLKTDYAEITKFSHSARVPGLSQFDGPTKDEVRQAGELLAYRALHMANQLADRTIEDAPSLISIAADGTASINEDAFKAAREYANKTAREDFAKGFAYQQRNNDDGTVVMKDGKPVALTYKPSFEITDRIWRIFEEQRKAVDQSARDVLLQKLLGVIDYKERHVGAMQRNPHKYGTLDSSMMGDVEKFSDAFNDIHNEGMRVENGVLLRDPAAARKAEEFLHSITRAMHNDLKLRDWTTGNADETSEQFRTDPKYAWVPDAIKKFHDAGLTEKQASQLRGAIMDLHTLSTQVQNADFSAKRTIMGAFAPFRRKGLYQVRVMAVDPKTGNQVHVDDELTGNMPYFKTDSAQEARAIRDDLNNRVLKGLETKSFETKNSSEDVVPVKLVVTMTEAPEINPLRDDIDFDQFAYELTRRGVALTPQQHERIVQAMSAHHSAARRNLMRTGNPGWDPAVVRYTAEHLEMMSHVAGKNRYRYQVNDVRDNRSNWFGDAGKLADLQDAYKKALNSGNVATIHFAHEEMARYQHMYMHMSDDVPFTYMKRDGTTEQRKGMGHGQRYLDTASKLLNDYGEHDNIIGSVENAFGRAAGGVMSTTAALQLGLSVASAAVNMGSLATHAIPYLASYNPKTGFGGGFSSTRATAAVGLALRNLKNSGMGNATYLADVLKRKAWGDYGLSKSELEYLLGATRSGILDANVFNAMTGTARSDKTHPNLGRALSGVMAMFTYTEQLNRRVTALAAYRLEAERMAAAGIDPTSQEGQERLATAAERAVDNSQGEYARYNRPQWARGNMLQFLFMYKQFVVISVELMRNMGIGGTTAMIAMLFLMAGLKGVPFGDDLMEVIDTIMQKMGIKSKGVETYIAQFADQLVPGLSPLVLRGMIDWATGVTVSSRTSLGDIVPLTGAFKVGADPVREMGNFFGPVYSSVTGMAGTASDLVKYGAETLGLRNNVTDLSTILRNSPMAAARSLTEGYLYLTNGAITNSKGQMVSPNANALDAITRVLGFYPAVATQQNDIVRMSKATNDYARSLTTEFKDAYVRAIVAKDDDRAHEILAAVRDWNEGARGGPFEISNFEAAARRAAREGNRSAAERYLKSAPRGGRGDVQALLRAYDLAE